MRDNWLDDELNEMFQDFDSEMNLENEWAALQQRRKSPTQPNRLWFLLVGVAVVSASWYFYSTSLTQNTEIDTQLTQQISVTSDESNSTKKLVNAEIILDQQNNFHGTETHVGLDKPLNEKIKLSVNTQRLAAQTLAPTNLYSSIKSNDKETEQLPQSKEKYKTQTNVKSIESHNEIERVALQVAINKIANLEQLSHTLYTDQKPSVNHTLTTLNSLKRTKANKAGAHYLSLGFGYSPLTTGATRDEEKAIDGISTSLHYMKYLSPNLYLKTGINLDKFTTRVKGTITESNTQMEDNQIIKRYYNFDGTIEYVYGEGEVIADEVTQYHLYNRYQFVSVPVIFGLEVLQTERSYFAVEGGISATIFNQYDIKKFDGINTFNSVENQELKTAGIFSGLAAISWHYQPQALEKLDFFCRVGSRFQLNDLSDNSIYNVNRFHAVDVGLGIQYRM